MRVPDENDWGAGEAGDLDLEYARKVFFGRSPAEAIQLLRGNVLERAEDLRFMPAAPFRFYMLVFREYVLSDTVFEDEIEAASAADSFLGLVEVRLAEQPASVVPIITELLDAAHAVARRQSEYGASVDIYGEFTERVRRIEDKVRDLRAV
jgi:hypothetical protein